MHAFKLLLPLCHHIHYGSDACEESTLFVRVYSFLLSITSLFVSHLLAIFHILFVMTFSTTRVERIVERDSARVCVCVQRGIEREGKKHLQLCAVCELGTRRYTCISIVYFWCRSSSISDKGTLRTWAKAVQPYTPTHTLSHTHTECAAFSSWQPTIIFLHERFRLGDDKWKNAERTHDHFKNTPHCRPLPLAPSPPLYPLE